MEIAPKDGSFILVKCRDTGIRLAWWEPDNDEGQFIRKAHWQFSSGAILGDGEEKYGKIYWQCNGSNVNPLTWCEIPA